MRILIVAAHPDDETIGASAWLGGEHEVIVVHATDGAPLASRWRPPGAGDRQAYACVRRSEAERALALARAGRVALGFADQETPYALPALIAAVAAQLARWTPEVVITHAYEGGHPDHDSVAFAVARATAAARGPRVLEMALYHGAPGELVVGDFVAAPSPPPLALDDAALARRRAMLACYTSQQATLAPFVPLAHERFRPAPRYDFTLPPHSGPLWYERHGMADGVRWRALAACASRR